MKKALTVLLGATFLLACYVPVYAAAMNEKNKMLAGLLNFNLEILCKALSPGGD